MSVRQEEPLRRVRMSWEEFLELPHPPKAEWVNGEVVIVMAPVLVDHGDAVMQLGLLLGPRFPDLYLVPEVFLHLPRDRVRAPDLMLVRDRPADGHVREAPLLVIEVLSPSTRSEDTIRKSMEYAEGGVEHYWVVDPDLRAIDLWHNAGGEWDLLGRVDDHAPTVEVEIAGVRIPIDLRQILGDRRTS